jgi:uncharacterized protein
MDHDQNNDKRFIYFYLNRQDPDKIQQTVSGHIEYWRTAELKEYVGGPFADRTGGLITFAALSLEEATSIILQDPFVQEDLISERWIKEWVVE